MTAGLPKSAGKGVVSGILPKAKFDGLLEEFADLDFRGMEQINDRSSSGVNYPSNMLYALALESISKLYGDQSSRTRRVRSRDSQAKLQRTFFEDNRLRKDGA